MKKYDVIVIGAGPSGIMAAIFAAQEGRTVLLLEKNEQIGRKILATGNGRCNVTNRNIEIERYHGAQPEFIKSVLYTFTSQDTINFFESQGVLLKEEDRGRIFPRTNQASTIVSALKHVLEENGVQIKTGAEVKELKKSEDIFEVTTDKEKFTANKIVLTTGGRAAHILGSSGDGLWWAKNLGHTIVPVYASLVPMEIVEEWVKDVQGVKVEAKISSYINEKLVKTTEGDLLFTHFGISGPAVMAHSGALSPFVEKEKTTLKIDLMPELTAEELDGKLEGLFKLNSKKTLKNVLSGLLPSALAPVILNISQVADKKVAEISRADRLKIVATIKELTLNIKKVRPLKEAQVSRGGVDATEINPNSLESKTVPGLYFAGEIIDVDGDSGGFNLQWAWASGYLVGTSI